MRVQSSDLQDGQVPLIRHSSSRFQTLSLLNYTFVEFRRLRCKLASWLTRKALLISLAWSILQHTYHLVVYSLDLYNISIHSDRSPHSPIYTVKLSDLKIHNASLCLTNNPNNPHIVCIAKISIASLSSLLGPHQTSQRFRIVKLLLSTICPSLFVVTLTSFNLSSIFNASPTIGFGGYCHSVTEGSNNPVLALKRGSRCRGQGIIRKSWGAE